MPGLIMIIIEDNIFKFYIVRSENILMERRMYGF